MFEIGNSLREARYRQQLELTEIEQATKIRGRYLRALEEESFDVITAPADLPAAREALALALEDGDADVRAYARQALASAG